MLRPQEERADERLWRRVTLAVKRTSTPSGVTSADASGSVVPPDVFDIFERDGQPWFVRLMPRQSTRATALSMVRALYPGAWQWGEEEAVGSGEMVDVEVVRVRGEEGEAD